MIIAFFLFSDTRILISFLRYSKYSQLKARKTIENYCKYKRETPTWFESFNPDEEFVYKVAKTG